MYLEPNIDDTEFNSSLMVETPDDGALGSCIYTHTQPCLCQQLVATYAVPLCPVYMQLLFFHMVSFSTYLVGFLICEHGTMC